jgi:peptide deformylase
MNPCLDNINIDELEIVFIGNAVLEKVAVDVDLNDQRLSQLIARMKTLMLRQNGVGIAAPQLGVPLRLFITKSSNDQSISYDDAPVITYINPILSNEGKNFVSANEGCLSIPEVQGEVVRSNSITVTASDLTGKSFISDLKQFEARVVMHENDHLNGVLFLKYLNRAGRKNANKTIEKLKKKGVV